MDRVRKFSNTDNLKKVILARLWEGRPEIEEQPKPQTLTRTQASPERPPRDQGRFLGRR